VQDLLEWGLTSRSGVLYTLYVDRRRGDADNATYGGPLHEDARQWTDGTRHQGGTLDQVPGVIQVGSRTGEPPPLPRRRHDLRDVNAAAAAAAAGGDDDYEHGGGDDAYGGHGEEEDEEDELEDEFMQFFADPRSHFDEDGGGGRPW